VAMAVVHMDGMEAPPGTPNAPWGGPPSPSDPEGIPGRADSYWDGPFENNGFLFPAPHAVTRSFLVRPGSDAVQYSPQSAIIENAALRHILRSPAPEVVLTVAFWQRADFDPRVPHRIFRIMRGGQPQLTLQANANGRLEVVVHGLTTYTATDPFFNLPLDWSAIEIGVTTATAATGRFTVRLGKVVVPGLQRTGIVTDGLGGGPVIEEVRFGPGSFTTPNMVGDPIFYIDDAVVQAGTGWVDAPTESGGHFLGNPYIVSMEPWENPVIHNNWPPVGAGGNPADLTTYWGGATWPEDRHLASTGPGTKQTIRLGNFLNPASDPPLKVRAASLILRANSEVGDVHTWRPMISKGVVDYVGPTQTVEQASPTILAHSNYARWHMMVNPSTGLAWDPADLESPIVATTVQEFGAEQMS
jgi:hypothetical protein